MGDFTIIEREETLQWVETGEPLWLTADRERVVAEGDPEAAFLFASAGKRISREDAERYGLVKSSRRAAAKEPDAKPADAEPEKPKRPRRAAAKRSSAAKKTTGTRSRRKSS